MQPEPIEPEPTDDPAAAMSHDEIREALTVQLIAEGNPALLSKTVADIYATMYEFRVLIDGLQSSFGGPGGIAGKMLGMAGGRKRKDKSE